MTDLVREGELLDLVYDGSVTWFAFGAGATYRLDGITPSWNIRMSLYRLERKGWLRRHPSGAVNLTAAGILRRREHHERAYA
jgi:hypothetical protein